MSVSCGLSELRRPTHSLCVLCLSALRLSTRSLCVLCLSKFIQPFGSTCFRSSQASVSKINRCRQHRGSAPCLDKAGNSLGGQALPCQKAQARNHPQSAGTWLDSCRKEPSCLSTVSLLPGRESSATSLYPGPLPE